MVFRQKGPVQTFVKAGAVSEETARRPSSLGIQSEYLIEPMVRSGVLVATGDGRFYADRGRLRRRARVTWGIAAALFAIGLACAAWKLWGWWQGSR